MRRRFEYVTKQMISDLEARGKDAFERGHPYVSTNSMHWRRGWKNAQTARLKATVVVNKDDPDHRAMLERAEMMKRGGGWQMVRAWAVVGGTVAGWIVLLGIVAFSPVTPPPVDRGHDCDVNQWGCR